VEVSGEVRRASMRTGPTGYVVEDADIEENETFAPICMSESTRPMQRVVAAGSVRCARAVQ
jgi:hypothetical protein